jgi:hypothetical protein
MVMTEMTVRVDLDDACDIVQKMLKEDIDFLNDDSELSSALKMVLNYYTIQGENNGASS